MVWGGPFVSAVGELCRNTERERERAEKLAYNKSNGYSKGVVGRQVTHVYMIVRATAIGICGGLLISSVLAVCLELPFLSPTPFCFDLSQI